MSEADAPDQLAGFVHEHPAAAHVGHSAHFTPFSAQHWHAHALAFVEHAAHEHPSLHFGQSAHFMPDALQSGHWQAFAAFEQQQQHEDASLQQHLDVWHCDEAHPNVTKSAARHAITSRILFIPGFYAEGHP